MGLKFVFGRSGSGKTTFCLNSIKENIEKNNNEKNILLVPEQLTFKTENKLMKLIEKDEEFSGEVLSFRTLGNRIFTEVGGLSHRHLNSSGRTMLIYSILSRGKNELNFFKGACDKKGFIDGISDVLKEFKRFCITEDEINEAIEGIESETLREKLGDISLVLEKFNERLHVTYIDEEDEMNLLCEKIRESTYLNGANIYVDGFEGMNPIQLRVLEEIMKKANSLIVTIPGNGNTIRKGEWDLFVSSKTYEERLLKIAKENNISYEKPVNLNENSLYRFNNEELLHLEKYAFIFPAKEYENKTENIEIFTSTNLYEEVKFVANEILKLVRDKGYKYSDITVAAPNMDRYESLIEAVFNEYSVPIYLDKKKESSENPIVVLLLSALEVQGRRWSYEGVFKYVKSGLIDIPLDDVYLLENYVIENGIRGNRWLKPFESLSNRELENFNNEEEEAKVLERLNLAREKIAIPLNNLHKSLRESKNTREMAKCVYEFLLSIGIDKKIKDIIEDLNERGEITLSREYSQVFDLMVDILDQAVEVLGDESISLRDFVSILSSGFSEYKIGSIPSVIDSTLVVNADRMRNESSRVVFILGLNDGIIPSAGGDEGIINDAERQYLREMGITLDIDTKEKSFNEQYLIYKLLTSAREKLILSYPISDHEGKTLRQSIILHRLKKTFPNITQKSNVLELEDSNIENITSIKPTFNKMILKLRKYYESGEIDSLWLDTFRWFKENPKFTLKIESVLEGLLYTNQVRNVSREKISKLYENRKFSVSRLESYAKCPYAYFVKYGLKAKERRESGFKALEIGSFMHKILEDFSVAVKNEAMDIREIELSWIVDAVNIIVENMMDKIPDYILNSSKRYMYLGERLKKLIVNAIWVIVDHIKSGEFEAVGFEEGFGPYEKFPPIVIDLEDGEKVELIGKIDRIDEATINGVKYIRIIDYKSSKKKINLTDVYYGLQMQLLVYLDAILEGYEKKNIKSEPGGIFYFKLDEPIIESDGEISKEEANQKIFESFKMEGLILKEMEVVRAMDKNFTSKSNIVPVTLKKGGEFSATTSGATRDEFNILRGYVKSLIRNLCSDMLNGNISIEPFKNGNDSPCEWCEYSSICQFDISFRDNCYKTGRSMKPEVVIEKMREEEKNNVK